MPHSAVVVGRCDPAATDICIPVRLGSRPFPAAAPAAAATPPTGGALAAPGAEGRARSSAAPTAWASPRAHTGSRVRVQGKALKRVDSVVFQGAPGGADDVSVAPLQAAQDLRRRARAAHRGDGPVAVVSRRRRRVHPHRGAADDRPDRRPRRPPPTGWRSTSRSRATASSTAPSARRRSPTSCATRSPRRSRSS